MLHNTHSLPIYLDDIDVPIASGGYILGLGPVLDIPNPSRVVRPVQSYTGGNETDTFGITYYDNLFGFGPPAYNNKVLGFSWMPRLVEAQPGLPDAWDAPLLYEDRRNVFYVTTARTI